MGCVAVTVGRESRGDLQMGKKFGHSIFRHFHEFSSAFPATDVFHFFDDSPSAFHLATSLFPQCHRRQLAATTFDNYFSFRNQTIRILWYSKLVPIEETFHSTPCKNSIERKGFFTSNGGKEKFSSLWRCWRVSVKLQRSLYNRQCSLSYTSMIGACADDAMTRFGDYSWMKRKIAVPYPSMGSLIPLIITL